MPILTFLLPNGSHSTVTVRRLLNAGFTGSDQDSVQLHIGELKEQGVSAPTNVPALYPVAPYLAQQTNNVDVQHTETAGEAEWALIIDDLGRELIACASDHTDTKLEKYGTAWAKNAAPNVLSSQAWPYKSIADRFDDITLRGWVGNERELIQEDKTSALLRPNYWLELLEQRDERKPGTILLSGTIMMNETTSKYSNAWGASLTDRDLGEIYVEYTITVMSKPIE